MLRYISLFVILFFNILMAVAQDEQEVTYEVEFFQDASLVTSIVWAPDGRMFFAEKSGQVRLVSTDGKLQEEPVLSLNVRAENEDGLQSIVLDPNFQESNFFYVFYTELPTNGSESNVIVRYTEVNGVGTDRQELLRIPVENSSHQHNGGRMRFGSDGFLYVSVGDMQHYAAAQDISRPQGKIHRFIVVDDNLFAAPDNPFAGNSMWAYGLRNVFGFDFDPITNEMFATENGPGCDDEINLIMKGQNYNWGTLPTFDYNTYCDLPNRGAGSVQPLISFTPTIAPTGILIYDGDAFPQWHGQLFYCSFNHQQLLHIELNDARTAFASEPVLVSTDPQPGCAIELAEGPDGYIYYSGIIGIYRVIPS